jgi:hypothetical protein
MRASGVMVALLVASCGVEEIPRHGPTATPLAVSDAGAEPVDRAQPGVTIDGVFWPRDEVIVMLHVGHSNMAGRASAPPELLGFNYDTDPHLWAYALGGAWRPAREPLSPDVQTMGHAGPGMSILHAAQARAPDRIFVSIGRGQSGSLGGYCRNFRKGGLFYDIVMQPARELVGRVTFGAIFAMFGTSEADDPANIPNFGECIRGMVAEMRGDLGEPDLPYILGDWELEASDLAGPTSPGAMVIRPQMRQLVTGVARFGLVETDGLPVPFDDHHYDLTGYKLWGERALDILVKNGWTTWARP